MGTYVMSLTRRTPSAQIVVSIVAARRFLVGHGPRSAKLTIERDAQGGERADEAATEHLAPGDLRLLGALLELGDDVLAVVGVRGGAVPVVDHLVVVHQLARPLDRTDADEQQREARGGAEQEVLQADVQEAEVDVGRLRDREVARPRSRWPGPGRGRTSSRPAGWPGRRPSRRRRSAGAGAPGGRGRPPGTATPGGRVEIGVAVTGRRAALEIGHFALTPLDAIQTAKTMRPPMPTIQAHRPSLTGPSPPRSSPPWLGRECRSLR